MPPALVYFSLLVWPGHLGLGPTMVSTRTRHRTEDAATGCIIMYPQEKCTGKVCSLILVMNQWSQRGRVSCNTPPQEVDGSPVRTVLGSFSKAPPEAPQVISNFHQHSNTTLYAMATSPAPRGPPVRSGGPEQWRPWPGLQGLRRSLSGGSWSEINWKFYWQDCQLKGLFSLSLWWGFRQV